LRELNGALWRKATAAFRLLPFVDRSHPIIQELADMEEDDDDTEVSPTSRNRENDEPITWEKPSEESDLDSDSDVDSAAHVSTDAESEIEDGDY